MMVTNNYNPLLDECGNRRNMYFKTCDRYAGDDGYFERVFGPIRDFVSGKWNATFMKTLLRYMLLVDVNGWKAERLIREMNSSVNGGYNEHIER